MRRQIREVKYGPGGEWASPRQFLIQFQNIKTKEPSEFTGTDHLVVVGPPGAEIRRSHLAVRQGAPLTP
jgi:hypothetical protein